MSADDEVQQQFLQDEVEKTIFQSPVNPERKGAKLTNRKESLSRRYFSAGPLHRLQQLAIAVHPDRSRIRAPFKRMTDVTMAALTTADRVLKLGTVTSYDSTGEDQYKANVAGPGLDDFWKKRVGRFTTNEEKLSTRDQIRTVINLDAGLTWLNSVLKANAQVSLEDVIRKDKSLGGLFFQQPEHLALREKKDKMAVNQFGSYYVETWNDYLDMEINCLGFDFAQAVAATVVDDLLNRKDTVRRRVLSSVARYDFGDNNPFKNPDIKEQFAQVFGEDKIESFLQGRQTSTPRLLTNSGELSIAVGIGDVTQYITLDLAAEKIDFSALYSTQPDTSPADGQVRLDLILQLRSKIAQALQSADTLQQVTSEHVQQAYQIDGKKPKKNLLRSDVSVVFADARETDPYIPAALTNRTGNEDETTPQSYILYVNNLANDAGGGDQKIVRMGVHTTHSYYDGAEVRQRFVPTSPDGKVTKQSYVSDKARHPERAVHYSLSSSIRTSANATTLEQRKKISEWMPSVESLVREPLVWRAIYDTAENRAHALERLQYVKEAYPEEVGMLIISGSENENLTRQLSALNQIIDRYITEVHEVTQADQEKLKYIFSGDLLMSLAIGMLFNIYGDKNQQTYKMDWTVPSEFGPIMQQPIPVPDAQENEQMLLEYAWALEKEEPVEGNIARGKLIADIFGAFAAERLAPIATPEALAILTGSLDDTLSLIGSHIDTERAQILTGGNGGLVSKLDNLMRFITARFTYYDNQPCVSITTNKVDGKTAKQIEIRAKKGGGVIEEICRDHPDYLSKLLSFFITDLKEFMFSGENDRIIDMKLLEKKGAVVGSTIRTRFP